MVARVASQNFVQAGRPPLAIAGALAALVACGEPRQPETAELDADSLGDAISELMARGPKAAPEIDELEADAEGERLGEFRLTYYVMAREPEPVSDAAPSSAREGEESSAGEGDERIEAIASVSDGDADLVAIDVESLEIGEADADRVAIHADGCEVIAEVPREFARDLRMQGSGVLSDGRLVSAGRACDCDAGGICFFLPGDRYRWGIGAANRSLSPFRSVAVDTDVVALGQPLYIPELEGQRMPGPPPWGGFVHDGCVVADDRGGGVRGKHIDFFAARRGYYQAITRSLGLSSVTVYEGEGRCDELAEGRRPAT